MRRRPLTVCLFAPAGVALAVLATGCGGGKNPLAVASVASSTPAATTTTSTGPGFGSGGEPSGGGSRPQFRLAMNIGNSTLATKYSACMRKHGVGNFPDPNSQGVITFDSSSGIDPKSPAFLSAQSICQKLLPNGGQPTPQERAEAQQKLLAFSQCMRAHGIKDFPDPSNGGLRITSHPGSDLTPDNPQFHAAQQACQSKLPFKGRVGAK